MDGRRTPPEKENHMNNRNEIAEALTAKRRQ